MKSVKDIFLTQGIIILLFLGVSFAMTSPILKGKVIRQGDLIQAASASKSLDDYKKETGKTVWWTNSMFSGMPAFMITGDYPYSVTQYLGRAINSILPNPTILIFLQLIGIYLLFWSMSSPPIISFMGAVAYALSTYNIAVIGAGHYSKVLALAFAAILLAGFLTSYKKSLWKGLLLFTLGMGLELYSNHVQITYYTFLVLGIYFIYFLIKYLKENRLKEFIKISAFLFISLLVSLGTNMERLWNNYEYSKETIRGKSELTSKETGSSTDGLDKEYAFAWSLGLDETLSLFIPNILGGASQGDLGGKDSHTFKVMQEIGVPSEGALNFVEHGPTYFGEQSFTAGPAYMGSIIVFLAFFALIYLKKKEKWVLLTSILLLVSISWGKYFPLNDFLFDHFPLFNKFRSVTMTLNLASIPLSLLAIYGIMQLFKEKPKWEEISKTFYIAYGILAGICLLVWFSPNSFFDFQGLQDNSPLVGDPKIDNRIWDAIRSDRKTIVSNDALRSFGFISLAALSIFLFLKGKFNSKILKISLAVLVLIDIFSVSKRYFGEEYFVDKGEGNTYVPITMANQQILQDKSEYRVFNATTSFMNDGTTSYYHNSIGGYHAAKLRRYNELINSNFNTQTSQMGILNMLNTKYFIVQDTSGQQVAQLNPFALGNAWTVQDYKIANNANQVLELMQDSNPSETVVLEKKDENLIGNIPSELGTGTVNLLENNFNEIKYEANLDAPSLVVFSEIYYKGNEDWKAYVDGKFQNHFHANYVLRGMIIPAGKHQIEFKFDPKSVKIGEKIDGIASIFWILIIALGFIRLNKEKKA
ncbi:MAG: hypothetical protein RIR51_823 [Bacteroidota bacterium]|jgi:hypothetical protein